MTRRHALIDLAFVCDPAIAARTAELAGPLALSMMSLVQIQPFRPTFGAHLAVNSSRAAKEEGEDIMTGVISGVRKRRQGSTMPAAAATLVAAPLTRCSSDRTQDH